jgi:NAD(P)-dependent dehydrogenase (short-subunit alcohol dehydrogenase family)
MPRRAALVTGAGRGIGRAITVRLAAQGVDVLAVARTEADLREVAAETGAHWMAADLSRPADVARVVEHAVRELGDVDILVNNAALGSAGERPVAEQDPARWRAAIELNLNVPFELTRRLLPGMLARGWGRIVMVGSLAGERGGVAPGMSAYAASKHGLLGLVRATAVEVAPHGVTCNAVLPGSVRTRTAEAKVAEEAAAAGVTVSEAWRAREARAPAGRLVLADEVAAAVGFLCGEAASGVNGAAVPVQP